MDIHDPIRAYLFWNKVELRSPQHCWQWEAANDGHGYGAFGVAQGKVRKAYHVSYELTYGKIPDGKVLRHICGNPPCVNPYHLRVGTQADNAIDRIAMGREPVGESRSNSKLSNAEAREIHARHHQHGESVSHIASGFAGLVSEAAVYAVVSGRSFRSIVDPTTNDHAKAAHENEVRRLKWEVPSTPIPQGLSLSLSCGEQPCREPVHAVFTIDAESYLEARHQRDVQRFWSKVTIGDADACWKWTGGKTQGYGIFVSMGKSKRAHRIAWELHHGTEMPDDLLACHTCDHRDCVNPHHIYPGTHQNNADDTTARGRRSHAKGEDAGNSKLTRNDVLSIVARYNAGESGRAIALDYDITFSTIHRIMSGDTWPHLTGIRKSATPDYRKRSRRTNLTDDDVTMIRNRYKNGVDQGLLAQEYGLTDKSVRSLVSGRTFADVPNPVPLRERRIVNGGKLNEADVLDIRQQAHTGISLTELADKYGTSRSHISRIISGRAWPHVGGPVVPINAMESRGRVGKTGPSPLV